MFVCIVMRTEIAAVGNSRINKYVLFILYCHVFIYYVRIYIICISVLTYVVYVCMYVCVYHLKSLLSQISVCDSLVCRVHTRQSSTQSNKYQVSH
jgi:hypothetical protein